VTLSTGVGGGLVLGGRLQQGASHMAGHLGHIRSAWPPFGGDVLCSCGQVNCVETIASGTALARQGRLILGRECDSQQVLQGAIAGHAGLQRLVELAARVVAQAIADTRAITGVDVVRLGGGLGLAPSLYAAVSQALEALPPRFIPALEPAHLGPHAGLVGIGHWMEAHENVADAQRKTSP
jgi:N-acylmannosamine kinase